MAKVIDPIDVQAGSTILVAFVSTNVLKFPSAAFAGPERSEGKQAKLFVLRPDGQSTVVQRPMILLTRLATEAFIEIGDYSSAKASMVAALERELGIGDLEELNGVPMEEWPNIRAEATLPHRRALIAYLEAEESYEPDQYVVFGYLMAKAEAESELLNFALRGRQAERSQVTASEARRLQSRQATEKLRILARQLIEADREISLSRCARKVADTVSSDPTWEFKSDPTWISKHIKELFERRGGRLEYRPKRDLLPLTTDDHQETFGDH
jgi:hypothetical protein